jgi:hypothetical protein
MSRCIGYKKPFEDSGLLQYLAHQLQGYRSKDTIERLSTSYCTNYHQYQTVIHLRPKLSTFPLILDRFQ